MQVVCDVDKRIIAVYVGAPGSCADSTVFKKMDLYRKPHLHFSPGEYLIADSAYGLSMTCIPSYKAPAANSRDNTEFNYCVAKSRVRNEHCIGILKSRWGSLKEMRQQIRTAGDLKIFTLWAIACCVLHNMLARLGDAWEDMYLEEDVDVDIAVVVPNQVDGTAVNFRETLKKTTLETNYERGVLPIR